ncbi:hypothetical protein DDL92_004803 [Escherichia coli]|nr:hypothetical protein [Escherichia coli]
MRNHLLESMKAVANSMPDKESCWGLRVDADWHRESLLNGITFVGRFLEENHLRGGCGYSGEEISRLAGFLQSAPVLIECMSRLVEYCDQQSDE